MMARWQAWQRQFNQWPSSRRWLLLSLALVLTILPLLRLAVLPVWKSDADWQRQQQQAEQQQQQLTESLAMTERALAVDIDAPLRQTIEQQRQQLAQIKQRLEQTDVLMSVKERQAFLQGLLSTSGGLSLVTLNTQLPEVRQEHTSVTLYEHQIEVVYQGSYFDIYDFLQRLVKQFPKSQWERFEYQVIEYPKATIRMRWRMLSTDKEFISA